MTNSGSIHSTLDMIRSQTISNTLSRQKANIRKQIHTRVQNRISQDWNAIKNVILRDTVVLDQNGKLVTFGDVNDDGGDENRKK